MLKQGRLAGAVVGDIGGSERLDASMSVSVGVRTSSTAAECLDSAPVTPTVLDSDKSAPWTPTIKLDSWTPTTKLDSWTPTTKLDSSPSSPTRDSLLEMLDQGPLPVESMPSSPDSQDTVIQHQREMIEEKNRLRKRRQAEEELRAELHAELDARQDLAFREARRQRGSAMEAGVDMADTAFDETHATRCGPSDSELALAKSIAQNSGEFYVGGCQGIARRFLGCDMDCDRPMTGHRRDGWPCMTVFATREGPAGPETEVRCIKKLRREFNWGERWNEGPCKNKCEDARGLSGCSGVINFIYICHR